MDEINTEGVVNFFQRVQREITGNEWQSYLIAASVTIVLLLLVVSLKGLLRKRLTNWISQRGENADSALVGGAIRALFSILTIVPFFAGFKFLKFSPELSGSIGLVFMVLFTWRFIVFFSRFFVTLVDAMLSRTASYMGVRAVAPIITFVVWALGITFLLDNFGFKMSSILAGLGIMGVAVGLASQAILGDFFGYLAILLDRPFRVGDSVTVGSNSGVIERVGFKTTKIRMTTGELILVPNGDVSKAAITNTSTAESRGRVFQFGVTYETPLEKIKAIPDMVREIIEKETDGASLVRAHFIDFADSSLLFEVLFMVPGNSRLELLDAQHAINIALMERFAAEGIDFAYPTSTLYMANELRIDGAGRELK